MKRPWPEGKERVVCRLPAGFGDSIYGIAILMELKKSFPIISIRTRHPSLFSWIPGIETERWTKGGEDITAHYSGRKQEKTTNQWQDLCISANIDLSTKFKIDWNIKNKELVNKIKGLAGERKICLISSPHTIFGRYEDRYGAELKPNWAKYQKVIDALKNKLFYVQCGLVKEEASFKGIDLDLIGKCSDTDTLDIASTCDCVFGQHGWAIPAAEAFGKPLFVIYSATGLKSGDPFIRQCTAQKTFTSDTSSHAIDTQSDIQIIEAARRCYGISI